MRWAKLTVGALALSLLSSPLHASNLTDLYQPIVHPATNSGSVYFFLIDRFANGDISNDQGGLPGGKNVNGYDPADPGYFHGGDLKGAIEKLPYIKDLGYSAVWINPPIVNRVVQGSTAGYHGYWGLDFTTIDPHFGTDADFADFVSKAHQLGLRVILDVVVNHTADVITYQGASNLYKTLASTPYRDCSRKKFDSVALAGKSAFPKLCANGSFPYLPVVSKTNASIKKPAFLNDLTNYHNRGNNDGTLEALTYGDFYGLDDLFTEKPSVITGWIDLWGSWITKYKIDGFRIDTAQHVNTGFWKAFIPVMKKVAASVGIDDFQVFGEVYNIEPAYVSGYMKQSDFPSLLDFPLQSAISAYVTGKQNATAISKILDKDIFYTQPQSSAYSLMTFTGNHDMGRIGSSILRMTNDSSEALLRAKLANALLFTMRGTPISYYGDEVGMAGSGGDKYARQDMFSTAVTSWQSETRIGAPPIGTASSFAVANPLALQIKELNALRNTHDALAHGSQRTLYSQGSLLAIERRSSTNDLVIAFNNGNTTATLPLAMTGSPSLIAGQGGYDNGTITLPAFGYAVFSRQLSEPTKLTSITLRKAIADNDLFGAFFICAQTDSVDNVSVTFLYRIKNGPWKSLGTTDSPNTTNGSLPVNAFASYIPPRSIPSGTTIEVLAIAQGPSGERVATPITPVKISY